MPVLFAFREDRFGFRFELGERAVLGRSPECDLILFDRASSRFHAEITATDQGYQLNDLKSTNGTLLNEAPVTAPVILKTNDEIRVGQEVFLFNPSLDVAVGRDGVVLIVGDVDEAPPGALLSPPSADVGGLEKTQLGVLFKVAAALSERPKLNRVLKQAAYTLEKIFSASRTALLWPESTEIQRLTALLVRPNEQMLVLPEPCVRLALQEGRTVVWPKVITELNYVQGERMLLDEARTSLCAPLKTQGGPCGLLYVESKTRQYTEKDLSYFSAMASLIASALENAHLIAQLDRRIFREEEDLRTGSGFVGDHAQVKALLATAAQVAQTDARILLTGEMGTGKEVLAKRIHALSPRRSGPFVSINCASLSPTQIEATLFGHEPGTMTSDGAIGLLEEADGGTLFLKNIDHLPLSVQVDILRAFEEGVIYRVGSSRPRPVKFRTVSSTNVELAPMVADGEFREDLAHRLSDVSLEMPTLREIRDDIAGLVRHFVLQAARSRGLAVPEVDPAALECLRAYPWPGNVGELKNVCERQVMFSNGSAILLDDLPMDLRLSGEVFRTAPGERIPDTVMEAEKIYIRRALSRTDGDRGKAALVLGLSETEFERRMRNYDISLDHGQELQITGTGN